MSELALSGSHLDRRQYFRRSVNRSAELILRGDHNGQRCTVLDESSGGLQVETAQTLDLPSELVVKFSDTASQLVRRCWTNGIRTGYHPLQLTVYSLSLHCSFFSCGSANHEHLNFGPITINLDLRLFI